MMNFQDFFYQKSMTMMSYASKKLSVNVDTVLTTRHSKVKTSAESPS